MEITNELLAAYAEGNVSVEERDAVRKYLAENPSELESVMLMMDEDYEIEPVTEECNGSITGAIENVTSGMVAAFAPAAPALGMTGAAFTTLGHSRRIADNLNLADSGSFQSRLDTLLQEIDSL